MDALDNKPCFPHRHMSMKEYGLWDYLRSISAKSHVVHFDGRQIASQFAGASKTAVYRVRDKLIAGGWLIPTKPSTRLPSGHFAPGEYVALTHEQWAQRHPGQCRVTCPTNGTGQLRELPANFQPNASNLRFAETLGVYVSPEMLEHFFEMHRSQGKRRSWQAVLRKHIENHAAGRTVERAF